MEDGQLVSLVLAGDKEAFRQLIKQNERLVFHMVSRLVDRPEDQEELCQDVFVKVYEKLPGFKFQSKLSTWIGTIAYRISINHMRKTKMEIEPGLEDDELKQRFVDFETPEEIVTRDDRKALVKRLIEKIPPQYRVVLTLFHLEDMSYPEIKEITGFPEGTVKSYLFRARKLLKEQLEHYIVKGEVI